MSNLSKDPVFPGLTYVGLTKREYFAAVALQGLLSCPHQMCNDIENQAGLAVEYADRLIQELSK